MKAPSCAHQHLWLTDICDLAGQPIVHTEEEILALQQSLNKTAANEPSRLETLVLTNQVDVYSKQISEYGAAQLSKLFLVKALAK